VRNHFKSLSKSEKKDCNQKRKEVKLKAIGRGEILNFDILSYSTYNQNNDFTSSCNPGIL
jgi:hypothetical protein